ncbi:MAG TPA: glutamine synthetase family protein [Nitrolancea sp.]|nr:glutamine synthetase family protein [Nitrolancea sp.]
MPEDLASWMRDKRLDHLWVAYTDFHGRLAGRDVPLTRVPPVAERGTNFAKANFNFTIRDVQVHNPRFGADAGDVLAVPDPSSAVVLPFARGTGFAFATLHEEDGGVWAGCARSALRRAVAALAGVELQARVAFEPEFYLFHGTGSSAFTSGGMYTIDALADGMDFVRRLDALLPDMGVSMEQIGKEYGEGQFEANIRPDEPLNAVDDLLLLRLAVRAAAKDLGLHASFMPKVNAAMAGSGLHVHLSLQALDLSDRTADNHPSGLSAEARAFLAGWLEHAEALTALASPTPNSYKRLQPASWAPAHIAWGIGNRAALVRVPGPGRRARLEFRAGDNTSNPYLFLAGLIWAGLDGLQRALEPPAPVTADVGHLAPAELAQRGIRFLPRQAGAALDALAADETLARGLGELIHGEFLRVKRAELDDYQSQVSDWERASYFDAP